MIEAELVSGELRELFGDEIYMRAVYSTTAYDSTFNTSDIHVDIYIGRENMQYTLPSKSIVFFNMDIDGVEWEENIATPLPIGENVKEVLIKSLDFEKIQHNVDGKKNVRMCAGIRNFKEYHREELNYESDYESVCRRVALTEIPQASAIKSFDNRNIYLGVKEYQGNIDAIKYQTLGEIKIEINPLEADCRHDAVIRLGEYSHTVYDVYDSVSFAPPAEWMNAMPAQTQMKGTVTIITYNASGSELGRGATWWNARIGAYAGPSIGEVNVSHIGCTWNNELIYVQGVSKAQITVSGAQAYHGASIVKYSMYCGEHDYSGTENTFTTDTLKDSGMAETGGYVQDSRGFKEYFGAGSAKPVVYPKVYAYAPPRFVDVTAERCETDGSLVNDGSYLKATVYYELSEVLGIENTAVTAIEYKKTTESSYTRLAQGFGNGTALVTEQQFDVNAAYNLRLTITDKFAASSYETILPVSFITMEFLKGGRGISFGKECTIPDAMDIGFKLYARAGIMPITMYDGGEWSGDLARYSLFSVKVECILGKPCWIMCFHGQGSDTIEGNIMRLTENTGGNIDGEEMISILINVNSPSEYEVIRSCTYMSQISLGVLPSGNAIVSHQHNGSTGVKYAESIKQVYALL
ncbi:MAG: DUF859 family phage minor structural protein [bacterium]|nr:DUF859 family phage minor structural protein [bacterium]